MLLIIAQISLLAFSSLLKLARNWTRALTRVLRDIQAWNVELRSEIAKIETLLKAL